MKLKRPVVLSIIAIIVVWSGFFYIKSGMILCQRKGGKILYSFNGDASFHSRNIRHYERVAGYLSDNITYFDYSFVHPQTGQAFEPRDVKQWIDIYRKPSYEYIAKVYNVEKTGDVLVPSEEISLNNLPVNVSRSLDKLYNGRVEEACTHVDQKKLMYFYFVQRGGNIWDRQIILHFPNDEHNLNFGYYVARLKRNNWYYIDYGAAG